MTARRPLLATRLRGLPTAAVLGLEVPLAIGVRARLLGLALLDRDEAGVGLLIPRCAGVHTFGMRFRLDVYFLDRDGRVCGVRRGVPGRRALAHRGAASVLELPSDSRHLRSQEVPSGGEFGERPA